MKFTFIIIITIILSLVSCKKGWLEIKPDKALIVPAKLKDFQALLDNASLLNLKDPLLPELGSDDYSVTTTAFLSMKPIERNAYIWAPDIFEGSLAYDWSDAYEKIYYANVVLEGLENLSSNATDPFEYHNIKGQALFIRAISFYHLVQLFADPYDSNTSLTDLGIPLRLNADLNETSKRSTVEQSYQQIINDLTKSIQLLPDNALVKMRPSKVVANGLLARVYLSMGDFQNAYLQADASLAINNSLMDFNLLETSASAPMPRFNEEVIIHYISTVPTIIRNSKVDSLLYASYEENDLRKRLFFRDPGDGSARFKGSYNGNVLFFSGITTSEMYLIKAEASAWMGNLQDAMNDLNTVMITRWETGTFIPFDADNQTDALSIILAERRKELLFRNIRWYDLRRLNKDSRFAKTLTREINGQTYTLPPNDARYTYPIPDNEIELSGIEQNPR